MAFARVPDELGTEMIPFFSRMRPEPKLGRPRVHKRTEVKIRSLRAGGVGKRKIAAELKVGVSTVMRVLADETAGRG